jgi:DNA replication protein DnaC
MLDWQFTPEDVQAERERLVLASRARYDVQGVVPTLRALGVPKHLAVHRLSDMANASPTLRKWVARIVEVWPFPTPDDAPAGLCLSGVPGTGKTALASAVMRAWVVNGRACRFISSEDFFRFFADKVEISQNASRISDYEGQMLEWRKEHWRLRKVYDLLVLDDIGRTAGVSDFFRQEMQSFLRDRQDNGVHTIVTTNLSWKQWEDTWGIRMTSFLSRAYENLSFLDEDILGDG